MLKLLILCLLVVCPMIANSRKANDLEVAKVKSQVNSCVRKTKMEGLFCVVDSMLKWDLTRFSKSHNDKASCCAFWDTTNCLVEKAIQRCTDDELASYSLMIFYDIAQTNAVNCTEYQYSSDSCESDGYVTSRYKRSVRAQDMFKAAEEMPLLEKGGLDIPQFQTAEQVLQKANKTKIEEDIKILMK